MVPLNTHACDARLPYNAQMNTALPMKTFPPEAAEFSMGDPVSPDASLSPPPAELDLEDQDQAIRETYVIHHDLQKRADLYLRDRLPDYSRAALQKLIKADALRVNGRIAKASTVLRSGDVVEILLPPRPPDAALPENIPLDIVYEDDQFLAVNKQAGLIVHPARGHWSGTLINALLYHGQKTAGTLSTGSDPWRPGIIHRLDRETTGLILIAKTDEAHWRLAGQFERRTIQKTYLAIVHGEPALDNDLIDAPLAVHPHVREKYAVRRDIGKPAQTVFHVARRFGDYALLEMKPKTGRTHQLRVHAQAMNHPMVGDTMYGGREITITDITHRPSARTDPLIQRQALHAHRLQFVHPTKFHRMTLEAPPPDDMALLLEYLENTRGILTPRPKREAVPARR